MQANEYFCKPIPIENGDSLSKEWFELLFSSYYKNKITIIEYKRKTPQHREGFLSEIDFVEVQCENSDDVTVLYNLVIKFNPEEDGAKAFMQKGNLGWREVQFLRLYSSKAFQSICQENLLPTVLYSEVSEEDSKLTIVMEDLTKLGYKTIIEKDGLDKLHAQTAVKFIADFHAYGIIYKHNYGDFIMTPLPNLTFINKYIIEGLEFLVDYYNDDKLKETFKLLINLSDELATHHLKHPFMETIIHGDYWAGNIMYSCSKEKVKFVDFQFTAVGNPVLDLMQFFMMSCNPDMLEQDLNELLFSYWTQITGTLNKFNIHIGRSYDQFLQNVNENWVFGFMFTTASMKDFIIGDSISHARIKGFINFTNKRNVLSNFLKQQKC